MFVHKELLVVNIRVLFSFVLFLFVESLPEPMHGQRFFYSLTIVPIPPFVKIMMGVQESPSDKMECCHLHSLSFFLQLLFPEMNITVSLLQPVFRHLVSIILVDMLMMYMVINTFSFFLV